MRYTNEIPQLLLQGPSEDERIVPVHIVERCNEPFADPFHRIGELDKTRLNYCTLWDGVLDPLTSNQNNMSKRPSLFVNDERCVYPY